MAADEPSFRSTDPVASETDWAAPDCVLTWVYPSDVAGRQIALRPGLVLGRAPESGITCVPHSTVSRRHARVQVGLGGGLFLEDLGSRNGASIDGQRSTLPMSLARQSIVRLGDVFGVVHEAGDVEFLAEPAVPGTGAEITRARRQLGLAAVERGSVLIIGETGTGKERLAAAVHRRSGRRGPYLTLNCAELSAQLIESQLFGHERGAFTGATAAKAGLFAAADGGTLLLDEVGELPLDLQPKLLRVLQEGELRPLGGTRTIRVDVRVVAATNQALPEMIARGAFRRDLYARLSAWEIRLPPLRERKQDLFAWLDLLERQGREPIDPATKLAFSPDAAERVLSLPWLDNLRGLERIVHRLGGSGEPRPIGLRALGEALPELRSAEQLRGDPPHADPNADVGPRVPQDRRVRPAKEEFLAVYNASGRSVRATSKHFGCDRRQIYRWLDRLGIPRDHESE